MTSQGHIRGRRVVLIRRVVAALTAALLVAGGLAGCSIWVHIPRTIPPGGTSAPVGDVPAIATFDPAFIVSDAQFFDESALTQREVQRFLLRAGCQATSSAPCLWEYRTTTPDRAADAYCDEYVGEADEPAASIIVRVARACGVSPKVLLVLLQKEQSLLTRPTERGYRSATGYNCPDTADCDARFYGFFNQVYSAARQFQAYRQGTKWRYRVGEVAVKFNPDPSCGQAVVNIQNQATAGLYNYTPYQPTAEAIANPDDSGPCRTFGNLNFWRLWSKWFGNPHSVGQ
ncbi:MAG TPA: hypothetical protein VFU07_03685 [Candidatus Lumbricidophila sp.]|nr:hypothetical protein [Candidatus Lumbricidophila sp.]